jgi:hypothetical protein
MGYGSNAVQDGSSRKKSGYFFPGLGRSGHIFLRQLQAKIDVSTYPLAWERPAGKWGIKQSPFLNITNKIDGSIICRLEVAYYGKDLKVVLDYFEFLGLTNEYQRMVAGGYIEMIKCLLEEAGNLVYEELKIEKKAPVVIVNPAASD